MLIGYQRRSVGYQKRELEPYVSINRRGEIVLNRAAQALLNGANYVHLFYDAEKKQIGIAWPKMGDYGLKTFTLRRHGRGGRSRNTRRAVSETVRHHSHGNFRLSRNQC